MFAIVQIGTHQYQVFEKKTVKVEKLATEEGQAFSIDQVLLLARDDNSLDVGTPFVPGASVQFQVLKQGKGEKVRIFKMKAKKHYKRTKGHRQPFTELEVVKIAEARQQ